MREGLTRDIKRTSYYEKPSEKRRRKTRKAQRKVLMPTEAGNNRR